MSIADFSTWKSKVLAPWQIIPMDWLSGPTENLAGHPHSGWQAGPTGTGVAPTTPAVPDNTFVGGLGQQNSSGVARLARVILQMFAGSNITGCMMIVDRLSHQGGLDGTVATAQTTNFPTAALTRYTSGVGVMIGFEIYTAIGATGTTITASYTNQAGSSGRTTQAAVFGGNGFNGPQSIILCGLQSGDTGVQAVASVTLAASTLTVGNFGVTLFRPLAIFPLQSFAGDFYDGDALLGMLQPAQILSSACLQTIIFYDSNTTVLPSGVIQLVEE